MAPPDVCCDRSGDSIAQDRTLKSAGESVKDYLLVSKARRIRARSTNQERNETTSAPQLEGSRGTVAFMDDRFSVSSNHA